MNKKRLLSLAPLAVVAAGVVASPVPAALAAPVPAQVVPGEIVGLAGTPDLWIADDQGLLHFASDPNALAGHAANWNVRADLTYDQLATLPHGAPWLSTPLVKIGDGIYLPVLGPAGTLPTLRHIQSTDDLAQIGITAGNYGQLVLDQSAWEQHYGVSLQRAEVIGDLALLPQPATSASNEAASTDDSGDSGTGDTAVDVAS